MLTYEVHKENEFSRVFYTGDDALKFINDNKYLRKYGSRC